VFLKDYKHYHKGRQDNQCLDDIWDMVDHKGRQDNQCLDDIWDMVEDQEYKGVINQ